MKAIRETVTNLAKSHVESANACAEYAKGNYIRCRGLSRLYREAEAGHRFCAKILARAAKSLT